MSPDQPEGTIAARKGAKSASTASKVAGYARKKAKKAKKATDAAVSPLLTQTPMAEQQAPVATAEGMEVETAMQTGRVHPFERLGLSAYAMASGDLYGTDGQPFPELIEALKAFGPDPTIAQRALNRLSSEQVEALLQPARVAAKDRQQREHQQRLREHLPLAGPWSQRGDGYMNEGAAALISANPTGGVSAGGSDTRPTAVTQQRANTVLATANAQQTPTQEITAAQAADPVFVATALNGLFNSGRNIGQHNMHLQAAMTPVLHNAIGVDVAVGQQGRAIVQIQEQIQDLPDMASDLYNLRHEAVMADMPPPIAPEPVSGDARMQSILHKVDVFGLVQPDFQLRKNHSWVQDDTNEWVTEKEDTAAGPGNRMPFKDRLQEWAMQDAKATAALSGPTTKVRMMAPQPFSGEGEVEPGLTLMGFENYFSTSGLAKGEWGRQVHSLLRGPALKAYSALAVPMHTSSGGRQCPSWDQVRALVNSFKSSDTPAAARAQLASIRQKGKVRDYVHLFQHLLNQVGADPPARTDLLNYFLKGLQSPETLSPMGTAWSSLEAAQRYHLERELAELKVQGQQQDRHRPPFKPALSPHSTFKPAFRSPRLRAIAQRGRESFPPADGGGRGNGGKGRGGGNKKRGGHSDTGGFGSGGFGGGYGGGSGYGGGGSGSGYGGGGYGSGSGYGSMTGRGAFNTSGMRGGMTEAGPSRPKFDDDKFGTDLDSLLLGMNDPCPNPNHSGHRKRDCGPFARLLDKFNRK